MKPIFREENNQLYLQGEDINEGIDIRITWGKDKVWIKSEQVGTKLEVTRDGSFSIHVEAVKK